MVRTDLRTIRLQSSALQTHLSMQKDDDYQSESDDIHDGMFGEEAEQSIIEAVVPPETTNIEPVEALMAAWNDIKQDQPIAYDSQAYLKRIKIPGTVVDRPPCESCGKALSVVHKHLKCFTLTCVLRKLPKDHAVKRQAIDGSNAVRKHNWWMQLAQEAKEDEKERPAHLAAVAALPYERTQRLETLGHQYSVEHDAWLDAEAAAAISKSDPPAISGGMPLNPTDVAVDQIQNVDAEAQMQAVEATASRARKRTRFIEDLDDDYEPQLRVEKAETAGHRGAKGKGRAVEPPEDLSDDNEAPGLGLGQEGLAADPPSANVGAPKSKNQAGKRKAQAVEDNIAGDGCGPALKQGKADVSDRLIGVDDRV
ncbi:hypothetical protein EJ03DRAFT_333537 [Teratosphaeria nubilosa]|uniref:Uncharacterized protein n=1 Tax=Teratosphaeria nubilosa TaxID=161662 RepID=A0A6G1LLW2_9PEZI|nr:hypothetical protein EJ03DRAFT_333537 [Teratosphaeria nubilosa]